ncbi:MAG TPA: biopolymer transporter ExbD, partial [Gemmataceae bacterium]
LLDLVFQLIMFFIISANFVMEQINTTVQLPFATSAKSLDAQSPNLLFLNVRWDGEAKRAEVLRLDGDPIIHPQALKVYLENRYKDELASARRERGEGAEVETIVIIRADKRTPVERVYNVMTAAQSAGFKRVQLRAIIQ